MFKSRLKELRASRKWTQSDLAKKLNVSQQTIGSWEVGRAEPNSDALAKIAALFGTSVDYLLGIDDDVSEEQMNEILNFIEFVKNRDHKK